MYDLGVRSCITYNANCYDRSTCLLCCRLFLLALLLRDSFEAGFQIDCLELWIYVQCEISECFHDVYRYPVLDFQLLHSFINDVFSLIGTILFSFNLFGKVIGVCMLANAGFNCYIIFRYPEYEKIQRDDALSEIKGFLAANPAFAKTMVDAGVSASSEIIRNNPGTSYF